MLDGISFNNTQGARPKSNARGKTLGSTPQARFYRRYSTEELNTLTLNALEQIGRELNGEQNGEQNNNDLNEIRNRFQSLIKNNRATVEDLETLHKDLSRSWTKVGEELLPKMKQNPNDPGLQPLIFRGTVLDGLIKTLYPLYMNHLERASKDVLPLNESGTYKYPEKHSFFATSTQETGANGLYVLDLAREIKKGGTLESAFLRTEKDYVAPSIVPHVPTHRLSKYSTKDQQRDFQVLFITGFDKASEGPAGLNNRFIDDKNALSSSIQFAHDGKKLKGISTIDKPSIEELEAGFKKLSEELKAKNQKLYIFYIGHGNEFENEEGVSKGNSNKQGAKKLGIGLNSDSILYEDKIKELYNKYFKDIEVITFYNTCHSGAGITAVENEQLRNQINHLA